MDDVRERLRAKLAGRYEVEHEFGRGGMAIVYLAKDIRHERRVAIKVLRNDLGSSGSDRFLRETRTVAQLDHPHIVALHDSGSVDGRLSYVMPYVEGETLREKLERPLTLRPACVPLSAIHSRWGSHGSPTTIVKRRVGKTPAASSRCPRSCRVRSTCRRRTVARPEWRPAIEKGHWMLSTM